MNEFTIGSHDFRANPLAPKRAFHVARRIAPVIGGLKDLIPLLLGKGIDLDDMEGVAAILEPIAQAMAKLPEDDADYILEHCLEVVQVKVEGGRGWAPIQTGGALMYEWLTMPMMLQIAWTVLQQNLTSFFPAGAQTS
jgi:hypothetical protein